MDAKPVKFSQELLDQCVAALKKETRESLGYILILVEHPDDGHRMMVGTNLKNDFALCVLGGAVQSLVDLQRNAPGLDIDGPG